MNVSRFRPITLPGAGAHVWLKVDAKGCIVDLECMESEKSPAVLSAKDDRITRLAVLKAAAEFVGLCGQSREEVKSDHVLGLADKWLTWVNQ